MKVDYNKRGNMATMILSDDTVSPLVLPFRILVEVTSLCNFRCTFCPTGHPELLKGQGLAQGTMSAETFDNIIASFAGFPRKLKVLSWYYLGEPLLHKLLPVMVARGRQYATEHNIRTNGDLLTPDLSRSLIESGLTEIGVSIEALSDAGYYDITQRRVNYELLRERIAFLYSIRRSCHIYVKIVDTGLTSAQKEKFIADFRPISDSIDIEALHNWATAKDHDDFTLGTQPVESCNHVPLREVTVCPYPFFMATIRWDGTVISCCNDWLNATEIGNINDQFFMDIWHGDRLREFRRMQLDGRRAENRSCDSCFSIRGVSQTDVLDLHTASIAEKIGKKREE